MKTFAQLRESYRVFNPYDTATQLEPRSAGEDAFKRMHTREVAIFNHPAGTLSHHPENPISAQQRFNSEYNIKQGSSDESDEMPTELKQTPARRGDKRSMGEAVSAETLKKLRKSDKKNKEAYDFALELLADGNKKALDAHIKSLSKDIAAKIRGE